MSWVAFWLLFASTASAVNFKFRAREHFVETHQLKFSDGTTAKYSGLSNTLNFWHESPFKYSIGLSLSPILGSSKADDSNNQPLGSSLQLGVYGVEAKYYPMDGLKGFLRLGYGYTVIYGKGPLNRVDGSSYYGGLGWEVPVWKFHLAPEVAIRNSQLSKGVSVESFIFSLGFHFYKN